MPAATGVAQDPAFVLVDGHAYAYRAFHAIRSLASPGGQPTNAIYGFVQMLQRMRETFSPSHMAVVWDGGLAAERLSLLPGYKSERPPMPAGLAEQIPQIIEWLDAWGVASMQADGVEADDWIATLARQGNEAGLPVIIASADKDFMQLVRPGLCLHNPSDREELRWDESHIRKKTGLAPGQIVDWLSLIGDAVDDIPGVPGVGTKTATDLLVRFGSVDGIYARLAEVTSERIRERLREHEAAVRRNQALIRLQDALPRPWKAADVVVRAPRPEQLRRQYATWGFRTLLARVTEPSQAELL